MGYLPSMVCLDNVRYTNKTFKLIILAFSSSQSCVILIITDAGAAEFITGKCVELLQEHSKEQYEMIPKNRSM